jgi:hypothetical protein
MDLRTSEQKNIRTGKVRPVRHTKPLVNPKLERIDGPEPAHCFSSLPVPPSSAPTTQKVQLEALTVPPPATKGLLRSGESSGGNCAPPANDPGSLNWSSLSGSIASGTSRLITAFIVSVAMYTYGDKQQAVVHFLVEGGTVLCCAAFEVGKVFCTGIAATLLPCVNLVVSGGRALWTLCRAVMDLFKGSITALKLVEEIMTEVLVGLGYSVGVLWVSMGVLLPLLGAPIAIAIACSLSPTPT